MTEARRAHGPTSRLLLVVEEIREKRRNGEKLIVLALEYGVDETWICKLCRGRRLAGEGEAEDDGSRV